MRKKALALTLMMAFSWLLGGGDLMGQTTVTIGTGTSTTVNSPINTRTAYSLSETIYLSSEINQSSTKSITSIAYYYNRTTAIDYDIDVYMQNTDKTSFSSSSDYVTVSNETDLVFSGTVSFPNTAGWVTITLDNPFEYVSTSNLLIVVDNNRGSGDGSWSNYPFRYTSTNANTCWYASGTTNYNPTTSQNGSAPGTMRPNIIITFDDGDSCTAPTGLTAETTSASTANVSWTPVGDEDEWTLEYSTDSDFSVPGNITTIEDITTASQELTRLDDNTTYYVRVQANCGSGDSSWTDAVSFKTNTIESIPYKYCFEDDGDHDTISEWTLRDVQSGTGITTGGVTGKAFKFLGKYSNIYTQYLISPELSNTSNGVQVTISYYGPVANGNITLNVGYSSTYNTIESFTWSNQVAAANSYTSYTVTYPANTQYIAFKAYTNGSGSVYIDNIKLSVPTHTTENGAWNDSDTWSNGEVPTASSNLLIGNNLTIPSGCNATVNSILIDGGTLTIANGGKLTLSSCTNGGTAANLVIEDGGQLICNNSVAATVQKSIEASDAPTSKGAGWYTISSPVYNAAIASVTNLVVTEPYKYDLYRFNETNDDSDEDHMRWENYKKHGYTNFENGRGYIYRKNNNGAIAFVGNTNVGSVPYALTCSDVPVLAGFNLIGNPYPHSITKGISKAIYNSNLSTGYYILSNNDTWYSCADGDEIHAKQGILVKTSVSLPSFAISDIPYTPASKSNNDNIRFSVKNEQFEDVTYAWFDKGYGLPKIAHRNPNAPMLYIPQDGTNYATAIMDDNTETFGLNFKAMTMGKYTLRAKANGDYSYLHVIDRLTGEDVDMLLEDEYSFVASPSDNDNRFIVRLSYNGGSVVESDSFVHQSGSDIFVSGEGELQVFDVTGRKVMNAAINGFETISGLSKGVYIFRVIGETQKTQKIVVR